MQIHFLQKNMLLIKKGDWQGVSGLSLNGFWLDKFLSF